MTPGLGALLLAGALTAGTGEGTLGVRLLDGPERYVVVDVHPGDVLRRRVEISNGTAAPMPVQVYAAAASDGPKGFDYAEGRSPNELSSWTSVTPRDLVLPPGATAQVLISVRVPDSAAEGERAAVVWVEQAGRTETGLSLVNRVGMRVYVGVEDQPSRTLPASVAVGLVLLCAAAVVVTRRHGRASHAR